MSISFRPEAALNRRALRREAVQLGVIACGCLAALLTGSTALHVVAGAVSAVGLVLTGIASIVAWRVGGRGASLGLYVGGALLFLALAGACFML
jgi:hypothetical protein